MASFSTDPVTGLPLLDVVPSGAAGAAIEAARVIQNDHQKNTSNPHATTKAQIGLSAVLNALQLVAANNLSDLASASTARTNLGLGTAATSASTAFAAASHTHSPSDLTSSVPVAKGGTGLSAITSGRLLYASATNTLSELSLGSGLSISSGTLSATGGTGTVTSVGITAPSELSVSGSPITGSGTLALAWASQTTNKVLAAPNGSTGTPTFRSLVAADMPSSIDASKIGSGSVSNTEFGYLDGVTSSIQSQINALSSGGGSTPTLSDVLAAGNDADALDILNVGTIGIGTPSPGNLIHIVTAGIADNLRLDSSGTGIPGMSLALAGTVKGYWAVPQGAGQYFTDSAAGDMVFRSEANKVLFGRGSGASTLAVDGYNVGIGTASPSYKLHVSNGDLGISTTSVEGLVLNGTGAYTRMTIDSTSGTANAGINLNENGVIKWVLATYASGTFTFFNAAASAEALGIDSNSKATWTTANTSHTTDTFVLKNSSSTGQNCLASSIDGTMRGKWRADYLGNVSHVANGGDHYFWTGGDSGTGTTRVIIKDDGKVGIGTTSPSQKLHVVGGVLASGTVQGNALYSATSVLSTLGTYTLNSAGAFVYANTIDRSYVFDARAFYESAGVTSESGTANIFFSNSVGLANCGWIETTVSAFNQTDKTFFTESRKWAVVVDSTGTAIVSTEMRAPETIDPSAQGCSVSIAFSAGNFTLSFNQPTGDNQDISWHVRHKLGIPGTVTDNGGSGGSGGGGSGSY